MVIIVLVFLLVDYERLVLKKCKVYNELVRECEAEEINGPHSAPEAGHIGERLQFPTTCVKSEEKGRGNNNICSLLFHILVPFLEKRTM